LSGHLLIFAIDVIAVFSALLLAVGTVARFPRNRNARLVAAILLGYVCFVVLSRHEYSYWIPEPYRLDVAGWEPLLNIGRNLAPGLFMLLCHSLFQESRRFPRWLLALFALQILLEEPAHLIFARGTPGEGLVTEVLPALLESAFAGLAVYWTLAGWASDLVETRRRLRWIILLVIGLALVGSSLLLRMVIPVEVVQHYYAYVGFMALEGALLVAILLAQLGDHGIERYLSPEAPSAPARRVDSTRAPDPDAAAVAQLDRLMREERVYRQPGLSVAGLADQMNMPEYRLRKLIHEHLGHRNFNAFLHDYRIREACEMLRDPDRSRTPILTIALSVGYQSINTFNRGFREVMGVTPSAYRAGDPNGARQTGAGEPTE
jgi:AraC-like DNA-binding protein